MKLTPDQLDYIAAQDWREAMPFQSVIQSLLLDGKPTEYKKTYDIFETVKGDRLIMRRP